MTSIVVHYKELALKGRNRPWFVQLLVRNIRTALRGLSVRSVRSVMGRIEVDGFNRLVLAAGIDTRRVEIVRAYARYLRQIAFPFSQQYVEVAKALQALT